MTRTDLDRPDAGHDRTGRDDVDRPARSGACPRAADPDRRCRGGRVPALGVDDGSPSGRDRSLRRATRIARLAKVAATALALLVGIARTVGWL